MNNKSPKILIIDIETAPILASVWGIFDQNIPLNQIEKDWHIMAVSGKWLGEKEVFYYDQRGKKNIEDDKDLLKKVWKLLDEADVVIGQNSNRFDIRKLNARFIINGMQPPSSFQKVDTVRIANKHFGFTSNKLEYLSDKLCKKFKKSKHKKFPGFELWKQCMAGNIEAWKEMEEYNKYDVLSTEELYLKFQPWDNSVNYNLYSDSEDNICACGNKEFKKNGFKYISSGKYQRYVCKNCGAETRSKTNLLSKEKRESLRIKS